MMRINFKKKFALFFTLVIFIMGLISGILIFQNSSETIKTDHNLKIYFSFFIILVITCLLTYFISYLLFNRLLHPFDEIINKVDEINLSKNTTLLKEPEENGELKELIIAFNRMLIRIKEQSEQQNAFFASASHELRTPLSVMLTQLQILLKDKNISRENKQIYGEQLKEIQKLVKMVNDFLLLTELNNNTLRLYKKECDLSDIILNIIANYKEKSRSRNLHFKIFCFPAEENFQVFCDEDKLSGILNNLIINSIKYSKENSIIEISINKKEDKTIISILNDIRSDISPQINDIKNKFYHSKPLHGEGYGLGLWISRQLADIQDFELFFVIKNNIQFQATLVI